MTNPRSPAETPHFSDRAREARDWLGGSPHTEPRLPPWLRDLLPPPRQPTLLVHDGDGFVAWDPERAATPLGSDLEKAYDAVHGDGGNVAFDDSVLGHLPESAHSFLGSSIGVPARDGSGSTRLLTSYTDDDRLRSLETDWDDFMEADAAWRADPSDFYNSWT